MIKILATTRCGLIVSRYLAKTYHENRYVTAPELAEHYCMNVRSLLTALRQMTRAGVLRSRVGGKEPGFIFARDPKDISVNDLLLALEGPTSVPCCKEVIKGLKCDCEKTGQCLLFGLFTTLYDSSRAGLSALSVAQLSALEEEVPIKKQELNTPCPEENRKINVTSR